MGVTLHSFISPYTFLMGILWFNAFVLLSLLMRKLRYPIKLSVVPLALLLLLSILRMFLAVEPPGAIYIRSEVIFPAVVRILRFKILHEVFGFSVNLIHIFIFIWVVVAIVLMTRYVTRFRKAYWTALSLNYAPDEEAEAVLEEITGEVKDPKKRGRVFRTAIQVPFTVGIKPYIYLPEGVELSCAELRTVLRHEWKHIQSKDYLIEFLMRFINYALWWNPLTYMLRKNVSFALELRCDYFAVGSSGMDYEYYESALYRLGEDKPRNLVLVNALVNSEDEFVDRFKTLEMRMRDTKHRRTLTIVCFYLSIIVLFVLSYMFLVIPAHWESDFEHVDYIERQPAYYYSEEAYRAEEAFIVDNSDGTFSLYVDGQHVKDITENTCQEILAFFPVRIREGGQGVAGSNGE